MTLACCHLVTDSQLVAENTKTLTENEDNCIINANKTIQFNAGSGLLIPVPHRGFHQKFFESFAAI